MTSEQSLFLVNHEHEKRKLREHLDSLPDNEARLAGLNSYHGLKGFVDNSAAGEEFLLAGNGITFRAVCRPERARRYDQVGPPAEWYEELACGGCPIAEENVGILQRGKQVPYPWWVNRRPYVFLEQPEGFKFRRRHFTLASARDESQQWRPRASTLRARILDLHAAAATLPSYVLLWNGVGAGASIERRFHMHVLPKGELAIQQAAKRTGSPNGSPSAQRRLGGAWPLEAFRVSGPPGFVADEVLRLALAWSLAAGDRASESIAAFVEDGRVVCIYVPRDRAKERSPTFGAAVGAYEAAAGVFVFSSEEHRCRLVGKQMKFEDLWQILRDVRPETEFPV